MSATYECFSCKAHWTTNAEGLHTDSGEEIRCPDCGGWLTLIGKVFAETITITTHKHGEGG